jgi:hypothetical protein
MKYFDESIYTRFSSEDLRKGSLMIKKEFPNGPVVKTIYPDRVYSFNEIANHIRLSYQEISKSLHT